MSTIFYKFKSAKDFDSYVFEGAGVPVWELKNEIVQQKRLERSTDFDLLISNAQTGEEYRDESAVIPKNSSVHVKRVPVMGRAGVSSKFNARAPLNQLPPTGSAGLGGMGSLNHQLGLRPSAAATLSSGPPAAAAPAAAYGSEEARIQSMMQESSQVWDRNQSNTAQSQATLASRRTFRPRHAHLAATIPVHPNYICFRCGQKGAHHISVCPTNGDPAFDRPRLKKTTGIPRAFLRPTTFDPQQAATAGAETAKPAEAADLIMVTAEGSFVVAQANDAEWNRLTALRSLPQATAIPADLQCRVCRGWLQEPVLTACCQAPCCEECLAQLLAEEAEAARCPACRQPLRTAGKAAAADSWLPAPPALCARLLQLTGKAPSNKLAAAQEAERQAEGLEKPPSRDQSGHDPRRRTANDRSRSPESRHRGRWDDRARGRDRSPESRRDRLDDKDDDRHGRGGSRRYGNRSPSPNRR